jgi:hypothetical protein
MSACGILSNSISSALTFLAIDKATAKPLPYVTEDGAYVIMTP